MSYDRQPFRMPNSYYDPPDYDTVEWEKNRKHKASTDYPCALCTQKILKGETYVYSVYKQEGEFRAERRHVFCPWEVEAEEAARKQHEEECR